MLKSKIRAEFVRDKQERLIGIREIDIIHYCIRLFMEDLPADTESVTYHLHESYGNPRLEVKAGVAKFAEEITSYGDYQVTAKIVHKNGSDVAVAMLSEALDETYCENTAPEIRAALEQIKRL